MNAFHGRHFQGEIILWAVRWYCKYDISYRELQEMLAERGVNVDHTTIQRYAPEMEKRLRWYWRNPTDRHSWHLDETYVKVNGKWEYLYRAVDQRGHTLDFYLSARRNTKSVYCFLGKILNHVKKWQIPRVINIRPLAKVNLRASNSVSLQLNSFLNQIVSVYSYSVLLISENA